MAAQLALITEQGERVDARAEPVDRDLGRLTLGELYEQHVAPRDRRHKAAEKTFVEDRSHLRSWERFCTNDTRISCPSVVSIDAQVLERYQSWLCACPHCAGGDPESEANESDCGDCGRRYRRRSARTVNKHVGTAVKILRYAARKDWITKAPFVEPLPTDPDVRKDYLLCEVPGHPLEPDQRDEVAALYEALGGASWPQHKHFSAALLWRTKFVLEVTYGMNAADLVDLKKDASPLTWSQVHWQAPSPAQGGRSRSEHGWISFVRRKTRGRKRGRIVLPLTRVAAAHLRAVEPVGGGRNDAAVVPWSRANKSYRAAWASALERAGVPAIQIADLRNTCINTWELFAPGLVKHLVGHSSIRDDERILNEHYRSVERQLVEAVQRFPYGPAFDWIFEHLGEQRTLF